VEAIGDATLLGIQASQPASIRGLAISVPILEAADGSTRVGRFGWKDQHASLESFSADAYLNEMGITSPRQPVENTSDGNSVAAFDTVLAPEDVGGVDVKEFAQFIRARKVPPLDPALVGQLDTIAGEQIFHSIGCDGCHTPTIVTAPAGTVFNGGFTVSAAVGNKIIHPYSDFLLHNIGTHDPIVQNGGQATYNMVRTAPLRDCALGISSYTTSQHRPWTWSSGTMVCKPKPLPMRTKRYLTMTRKNSSRSSILYSNTTCCGKFNSPQRSRI
jgi:CxxC motif-containing protein (DUF1111 family)